MSLKSEDYGKHLLGVQDLLQKYSLTEADITTQTDRAKALKVRLLYVRWTHCVYKKGAGKLM